MPKPSTSDREMIVPSLLRARSSDEYAPLPWSAADRVAIGRYDAIASAAARGLGRSAREYAVDRRGTAATLRAIDVAHGGGFYAVPERATRDLDEAEAAFGGTGPVVDVQTHLVDPALEWRGRGGARRVLAHGGSRPLGGRDRPARDRRRRV